MLADLLAGVIQSPPNLPTWVDVPVKAILEAEFQVACRVENDANDGAVAEHRYGAGQGCQNMVFLTMGTGLGAGIIADGRLYHGTSDLAGEIGHVRLTRAGPVGHNKAGSVEGWASGGGVAQVARRAVEEARKRGQKTLLAASLRGRKAITARDVALAAERGDIAARHIIKSTGQRLGEALAILVDILNPERIVIGGLAMRLGETLLAPARSVMQREALAPAASVCQVVPAALGEQIGDIAALCVAMGF
jgi:glucokinase